MLASLTEERDDVVNRRPAFLSHSQINRYLICPEQYRFYYILRLRPKIPPASLVFGNIVHQALAGLFLTKADPVKTFQDTWDVLKDIPLRFKERESWEKLKACGERLLEKFVREEFSKIGTIHAVERSFELSVSDIDHPIIGVLDLVTEIEAARTVVDFKTSASSYDPDDAALSDQLTAYRLAEPNAEKLALCILVKTKEPKIEWHFTTRSPVALSEYLAKVGYVARQMNDGHFFKRSGPWCSWCDFRPICVGNTRQAEETLVQIA